MRGRFESQRPLGLLPRPPTPCLGGFAITSHFWQLRPQIDIPPPHMMINDQKIAILDKIQKQHQIIGC